MDSFTYQPPLRGAVLRLVSAKETPITAVALAASAQVPHDRALAYASILVGGKVLRSVALGYVPGPKWADWSSRAIRSRPRQGVHASAATMDAMRRPLAVNVVRLREAKGWSTYRLSQECGVGMATLRRMELRHVPPTFQSVVMIARALGVQVEALIS